MKMKNNLFSAFSALALVSGLLLLNSCKKNDNSTGTANQPTPPATAMSARDSAATDFNTNYLGTFLTNAGWTGNAATCSAGATRSGVARDRKSTRLNSSHEWISYAVFCLKKKKT